jgi:hypothetical protein
VQRLQLSCVLGAPELGGELGRLLVALDQGALDFALLLGRLGADRAASQRQQDRRAAHG